MFKLQKLKSKPLTEISINIDGIDPLDFFGVNNSKFNLLKKSFPTLRMVSRGNTIKAEGIEDDLQVFRDRVTQMVSHIERHGKVTEDNMERIISGEAHGRHPEKELKNV